MRKSECRLRNDLISEPGLNGLSDFSDPMVVRLVPWEIPGGTHFYKLKNSVTIAPLYCH